MEHPAKKVCVSCSIGSAGGGHLSAGEVNTTHSPINPCFGSGQSAGHWLLHEWIDSAGI